MCIFRVDVSIELLNLKGLRMITYCVMCPSPSHTNTAEPENIYSVHFLHVCMFKASSIKTAHRVISIYIYNIP